MNEAEYRAAVHFAQQSVIVGQAIAILRYFLNEGLALFVVVMEMHLDIGNAETHDLRNSVEKVAPVLLLRIEEGVLGLIPCAVSWSILGNPWPFFPPERNARLRSLEGRAHAPGLIVVGDCDPCSLDPACS